MTTSSARHPYDSTRARSLHSPTVADQILVWLDGRILHIDLLRSSEPRPYGSRTPRGAGLREDNCA